MLYKVGDKVRIKPIEEFRLCSGINSNGRMDKYAGTIMTIKEVYGDGYKMFEDQGDGYEGAGWMWYEHLIQGLDASTNRLQLIRLLMKG